MTAVPFVWNANAVATGLEELGQSRNELLLALKELVDNFHGIERTAEYYDLIAGDWLLHFSHNVYAAWCEVQAGANTSAPSPIPVASDSNHAASLATNINWHRHLRWAVAQRLQGCNADHWAVAPETAIVSVRHRQLAARKLLRSISISEPKVLLTSPHFWCAAHERLTALIRWRGWAAQDNLSYSLAGRPDMDWSWRKGQSSAWSAPCADFKGIAKSLLPLYVPATLLEGLEVSRAAALALNLPRPRLVFGGGVLHGNLAFKLLFAEWRQQGTRLLYQQHGGGYGLEPHMAIEEYETRVADRFYSWGWRRQGTNVFPLSPAMPVVKRNHRSNQILLNCLDLPRVPYRLMFTPMPGTIEDMHRNTCDFLRALSRRQDLTIRPYPTDYGWGAVDSMRAAAPEARFDSRSRGYSRYAAASLVVHNYLGTSWLETLGLNIPTVCFFDPAVYVYRDDSRAEMAALQAAGILHHSGKEAASFVSALGRDIGGWWNGAQAQRARIGFVEKYANFSPNWAMQWERELLGALDCAD